MDTRIGGVVMLLGLAMTAAASGQGRPLNMDGANAAIDEGVREYSRLVNNHVRERLNNSTNHRLVIPMQFYDLASIPHVRFVRLHVREHWRPESLTLDVGRGGLIELLVPGSDNATKCEADFGAGLAVLWMGDQIREYGCWDMYSDGGSSWVIAGWQSGIEVRFPVRAFDRKPLRPYPSP